MPPLTRPDPVSALLPHSDAGRAAWIRAYVDNLLALAPHMPTPPRAVVRYRKGKVPSEAASPQGVSGTVLEAADSGPLPSHAGCSILLIQTAAGQRIGVPVHRASLERPLALRGGFRDRTREFRFPDVAEAHFGGRQEKGEVVRTKRSKGKKG